jgi:hypothetical protein
MKTNECKKTSFADEKAARYYLDKIARTSIKKVNAKECYLCPVCYTWHLKKKLSVQEENTKRQIENLKKENEKLKNITHQFYDFVKSIGYDVTRKNPKESDELIFTKKIVDTFPCLA